jgi:hypothetical protein
MVMGLTQPLTEMSTTNLHAAKERPPLVVNNFIAIFELII